MIWKEFIFKENWKTWKAVVGPHFIFALTFWNFLVEFFLCVLESFWGENIEWDTSRFSRWGRDSFSTKGAKWAGFSSGVLARFLDKLEIKLVHKSSKSEHKNSINHLCYFKLILFLEKSHILEIYCLAIMLQAPLIYHSI